MHLKLSLSAFNNQTFTWGGVARQAARSLREGIGPGLIFWFFCIKAKEQKIPAIKANMHFARTATIYFLHATTQ
jgi:hypothetical protein